MKVEEAVEWLKGNRSMCNTLEEPLCSRVDANITEQAYWIVRAVNEGLVKKEGE